MKNLKNLGQALSKAEQKTINGGWKNRDNGFAQACFNPSNDLCNPNNADASCEIWETCVSGDSSHLGRCQCE